MKRLVKPKLHNHRALKTCKSKSMSALNRTRSTTEVGERHEQWFEALNVIEVGSAANASNGVDVFGSQSGEDVTLSLRPPIPCRGLHEHPRGSSLVSTPASAHLAPHVNVGVCAPMTSHQSGDARQSGNTAGLSSNRTDEWFASSLSSCNLSFQCSSAEVANQAWFHDVCDDDNTRTQPISLSPAIMSRHRADNNDGIGPNDFCSTVYEASTDRVNIPIPHHPIGITVKMHVAHCRALAAEQAEAGSYVKNLQEATKDLSLELAMNKRGEIVVSRKRGDESPTNIASSPTSASVDIAAPSSSSSFQFGDECVPSTALRDTMSDLTSLVRNTPCNRRRRSPTFTTRRSASHTSVQLLKERTSISCHATLFEGVATDSFTALPMNKGSLQNGDFEVLNQYIILKELGRGASGIVYLALDTEEEKERLVSCDHNSATLTTVGFDAHHNSAVHTKSTPTRARKRGHKTNDASLVAVKAAPVSNTLQLSQIEREIDVMKRIRHANIVTLLEVIHDAGDGIMYLVMDYIPLGPVVRLTSHPCRRRQSVVAAIDGRDMQRDFNQPLGGNTASLIPPQQPSRNGSIATVVASVCGASASRKEIAEETPATIPCFCEPVPLATVSSYLRQIVRGLHYLHHTCRTLHRDLKPDNILVGHAHFSAGTHFVPEATEKHRLFLADFGVSSCLGMRTGRSGSLAKTLRSSVRTPSHESPPARVALSYDDLVWVPDNIDANLLPQQDAVFGEIFGTGASNSIRSPRACVSSIGTTSSEKVRMSNLGRSQMKKKIVNLFGESVDIDVHDRDHPTTDSSDSLPTSDAFADSSDSGSEFSSSSDFIIVSSEPIPNTSHCKSPVAVDNRLPNEIGGTPSFMPPEAFDTAHPLTPSSDVWSLGVMVYLMVFGQLPYVGRNMREVVRAVCGERGTDPYSDAEPANSLHPPPHFMWLEDEERDGRNDGPHFSSHATFASTVPSVTNPARIPESNTVAVGLSINERLELLEWWKLIRWMLRRDPNRRITTMQLLRHPLVSPKTAKNNHPDPVLQMPAGNQRSFN